MRQSEVKVDSDIQGRNKRKVSNKKCILVILLLLTVLPVGAKRKKRANNQEARTVLSSSDARRLSYFYQEGIKRKLAGRYTESNDLFLHCLDIDPKDPDALFELGYLKFFIGEDSVGTEMMRRVTELDKSNPRYVQSLAAAYLTRKEYEKAIPVLEHLSELQSRRSDVLYQLMELYKGRGETDQAISVLNRIELLEGRSLQTTLQKYALYLDKGKKEKAFDVLADYQKESPYDLRIPIIRGRQYLDNDEPERALECFEYVAATDPTNADLRMSMMEYYAKTGQEDKRAAIRDSLMYAPNSADDLRAQMTALYIDDLKEKPEAQEQIMATLDSLIRQSPSAMLYSLRTSYLMYIKADEETIVGSLHDLVTADPSNDDALSRLLVYYLDKRDMEHVAEICRMGINTHPETLIFHFYLGVSLSQLKRNEEALEVLQNGLKQASNQSDPSNISDIYEIMGELHYEEGRIPEAFAAYDSCLVYKDDNAACLNNYAYYLSLRNERLEDAERMSYRAIKLEPLNKTYLDTYAWVLFIQGNYMMAKFYIDRVVSATQSDSLLLADENLHADVLEHAGDIYAMNGKKEEAVRYWSLAMKKGEGSALLRKKLELEQYIKE